MMVLVLTMVMGLGVFVYADDVCDLSEEEQALVLSAKSAFLGEKVADGTLTQEQADAMYTDLLNQAHNRTLKGLGFGSWLKDSEYADDLSTVMPHKNGGMGSRPLDGTGHKRGGRNN